MCPGWVRWRPISSCSPKELVGTWIHVVLVAAFVTSITQHVLTLSRPLTYPHAWGAAGAAVDARAFQTAGIIALKGIPINNNPPFGVHPIAYLHWPPLVYLSLSVWFGLWGESDVSIHTFTLVVYILTTGLLYWIIKKTLGKIAAATGTLGWLAMPVVVRYSHVVLNESLGFPFVLLALIAFVHLKESRCAVWWMAGGFCAMICAVLSSWEFVLIPAGLLAGALWSRSRKGSGVARIYLLAAVVTAAAVMVWYAAAYPALAGDIFQAALYRMGISDSYSNNPISILGSTAPSLSVQSMIWSEARNLRWGLGAAGWIAVAAILASFVGRWKSGMSNAGGTVFCALLAPPLVWFPVFSNHAAIHEFLTILLAPATAFAMAWFAVVLLEAMMSLRSKPAATIACILVLTIPLSIAVPLLLQVHRTVQIRRRPDSLIPVLAPRPNVMESDVLVEFGRELRNRTDPAGVVITPEPSSVPLYYSHRHIIAGVTSEGALSKILPIIRAEFPYSRLYLALLTPDQGGFPTLLASRAPNTSDRFIIVRLDEVVMRRLTAGRVVGERPGPERLSIIP